MKKPLVSILMNCYNCQEYLEEAIKSVYLQTYTNWEIIFIDNCSTDQSKKIVEKFDSKIKYYRTPYNMNLCNARVYAKEFIQGEYFCVLDTDDLWMPEKLEQQIKIMIDNDDIGIVYSNTICFNHENSYLAYKSLMPSGYIFKELLQGYFFSFETVMVRKRIMDENHIYFDPKYNVSSDAEFFIKLAYYTKCQYIDKPLAKWRYGHGSESDKHLCSFPKEYEIMLEDLSLSIDGFNFKYVNEINILKAKINNMYALCFWSKGDIQQTREYLRKASTMNRKYLLTFVISFFITYKTFTKLKELIKNIY